MRKNNKYSEKYINIMDECTNALDVNNVDSLLAVAVKR